MKRQLSVALGKTSSELARDMDRAIAAPASLRPYGREFQVGLIGPATYASMVPDLACRKAGFRWIAVPEFLASRKRLSGWRTARASVAAVTLSGGFRVVTSNSPPVHGRPKIVGHRVEPAETADAYCVCTRRQPMRW